MGRRVTSQVHIRYSVAWQLLALRRTEKLQEQCLAVWLGNQAWRGIQAVSRYLRKAEQNQGWLLFSVGLKAAWQCSRARSLVNPGETRRSQVVCRITGIMLNAGQAVFPESRPLPTPKTSVPRCCCNIGVRECLTS